nr:MAG TPA: hypothetical protein [Caudoviricetes sp.]
MAIRGCALHLEAHRPIPHMEVATTRLQNRIRLSEPLQGARRGARLQPFR